MNIRKLLEKEAKEILPDEETNNNIKYNLNIKSKEDQTKSNTKTYSFNWKKFGFSALAVCVCLAICLTIVHVAFIPHEQAISNSYINIDINPSFVIETDKDNNVLSVKARNKDAAIVLFGLRFENKNVNEVCNMILESSYKLGYLVNDHNVNLLTVNNNPDQEDVLNNNIINSMSLCLSGLNLNSTIIDVRSTIDDKEVKKQNKSAGTIALANIANRFNISDAFELSIEELNNKLNNMTNEEVKEIEKDLKAEYEILEDKLDEELDRIEETIKKAKEYLDLVEDIIDETEDKMEVSLRDAINYFNLEINNLVAPNDDIKINRYKGVTNESAFKKYYKEELENTKNKYKALEDEFKNIEDDYESKLDDIKHQIKQENEDEEEDDD